MDIKSNPAGEVVKIQSGYKAFVPSPLPPTLSWDQQLVYTLSQADHCLGKLDREGSLLPNPHLLIRPFIMREAVLSSRIEGTQATLGEVLAQQAGAPIAASPEALQEVNNYIQALDYGIQRLKTLPLSLRLIKELHAQLMQGVRGAHATPGLFRKTQNWIGLPGSTIVTARYVPPPPDRLMDCLAALEDFLHDRQLPALVHIALCHYQFEAIHPFLDGNGRVGRLLISLLLLEEKILAAPLLYLSAFFEATRADYYQQLFKVSAQGSWQEWLCYFLNGVILQANDALSRAERINKLIREWQIKVASSSSSLLLVLVKQLAVNPFITTSKVAAQCQVAFTTAQRAIAKLEGWGIVEQVEAKQRSRVFCATQILTILEEPTSIVHSG